MPEPLPELPPLFHQKMSGGRKLTDRDVGLARSVAHKYSVVHLAAYFGVKYNAMYNAIKGYSFRHLNGDYPPQW